MPLEFTCGTARSQLRCSGSHQWQGLHVHGGCHKRCWQFVGFSAIRFGSSCRSTSSTGRSRCRRWRQVGHHQLEHPSIERSPDHVVFGAHCAGALENLHVCRSRFRKRHQHLHGHRSHQWQHLRVHRDRNQRGGDVSGVLPDQPGHSCGGPQRTALCHRCAQWHHRNCSVVCLGAERSSCHVVRRHRGSGSSEDLHRGRSAGNPPADLFHHGARVRQWVHVHGRCRQRGRPVSGFCAFERSQASEGPRRSDVSDSAR